MHVIISFRQFISRHMYAMIIPTGPQHTQAQRSHSTQTHIRTARAEHIIKPIHTICMYARCERVRSHSTPHSNLFRAQPCRMRTRAYGVCAAAVLCVLVLLSEDTHTTVYSYGAHTHVLYIHCLKSLICSFSSCIFCIRSIRSFMLIANITIGVIAEMNQ